MKNKFLVMITIALLSVIAGKAQIAQGGVYRIEQSVIGGGGGTSADATGSVYKLDGTAGEPVAGTTSGSGVYSLKGGFLSSPSIAPTAASASVGGRVVNTNGDGLMNARVTLTDSFGNTRTMLTKKLGAFRFDDVDAGALYVITVASRRYAFQPQVLSVTENTTELIFVAQGAAVLSNTAP